MNPFAKHPNDNGMTYLQHVHYALSLSIRLLATGIASLIHAVLPFFFTTTASTAIKLLYRKLK